MRKILNKVKCKLSGLPAKATIAACMITAMAISACAEDAATTSAVTTVMTSTATDIKSEILAVAPIALGVGATILVIRVAWRFFKGLAKG